MKSALHFLILTVVTLLVSVNVAMSIWSHRLVCVRRIGEIQQSRDANLLLLGNSLMDGHVDQATLTRAATEDGVSAVALNAALSATQEPEQRLLFDFALRTPNHVHVVVVGAFDFQLTRPDDSKPVDLTGNRMAAIDRRIPMGDVDAAYSFGMLDHMEILALRALPMAANRTSVWKYVELVRRKMGENGMSHEETNSMGRVNDFSALEASSGSAFDKQAYAFVQNPNYFNGSYEYIFNKAQSLRIAPVIMIMPMSPYHRSVFYSRQSWQIYKAALLALSHRRGIMVIDASGWLTRSNDFEDNLHMSKEGVKEFSILLAHAIAPSLRLRN
jgi:hypothetical protein